MLIAVKEPHIPSKKEIYVFNTVLKQRRCNSLRMVPVYLHAHRFLVFLTSIMKMASIFASLLYVHDITLKLIHRHIYVQKHVRRQLFLICHLVDNVMVMYVLLTNVEEPLMTPRTHFCVEMNVWTVVVRMHLLHL